MSFGMHYVSREVFEKGELMDETQRQYMAEKSLAVLKRPEEKYVFGKQYMIENL